MDTEIKSSTSTLADATSNLLEDIVSSTPVIPCLTLAEMADEFADEIGDIYTDTQNGIPLGPKTGFAKLDEMLGGRLRPGLHTLTAEAKIGKTAFALQIAAQCARPNGVPCLYVTTEMTSMDLAYRVIARSAGIEMNDLDGGRVSKAEAHKYALDADSKYPLLTIANATENYPSIDWLYKAAKRRRGDNKHLLVIVDSISTWADLIALSDEDATGSQEFSTLRGMSEYQLTTYTIEELKKFANTTKTAILGIVEGSQASNGTESRGNSRFNYRAVSTWNLSTGEADLSKKDTTRLNLSITRSRFGRKTQQNAPLLFTFEGKYMRFAEGS